MKVYKYLLRLHPLATAALSQSKKIVYLSCISTYYAH